MAFIPCTQVISRLLRLWPVDSLAAPFTPDGVEGRLFFVLGNVRARVQSLGTPRGHLAANRSAHRSDRVPASGTFDSGRCPPNEKLKGLFFGG